MKKVKVFLAAALLSMTSAAMAQATYTDAQGDTYTLVFSTLLASTSSVTSSHLTHRLALAIISILCSACAFR